MTAYQTVEDIVNRTMQHLQLERIDTMSDHTAQAIEATFAYDKVRLAELRRNLWRFAIRRCILRPVDTTTKLYTPPAYASGTTYALGAIVLGTDGEWWQSAVAANLGNSLVPGAYWRHYYGNDTLAAFDDEVSYYAGELVSVSSAHYLSLVSSNLDNTPPSAGNWLLVTGTVTPLTIVYPIGTGPGSDSNVGNVYRLPHGYLRQAPQDPKAGINGWLGVPGNLPQLDWLYEGRYFVTHALTTTDPQFLRYVADMTDVIDMDPMFCEAFSAKLGTEIGPTLLRERKTPDRREILTTVSAHYRREITEARAINGIEQGQIESPLDPYLACRV